MKLDWSGLHVLALSPHTDDVELGAGGTIKQMADAGARVICYAMAGAEPHAGEYSLRECEAALSALGVDELRFWDFSVHRLEAHRQEILDRFIAMRDTMDVDVVLCPARHDIHQDHRVVTSEAIRAFKRSTILGYDLPWNTVGISDLDVYVALQETDMKAKERALACYRGQINRPFFDDGLMRSVARIRGQQCGRELAEAYECIRFVM